MLMRVLNYLMIVLFAYSAVVQLNDPDPLPWFLVYAGALAFCILWIMREVPVTFAFVFAGACLLTGLKLLAYALSRPMWVWDDKMNEPAGLIIVFLWVSSLAWMEWKQNEAANAVT